MAASGLRSSCDASATKRRSFTSDSSRAVSAPSTRSSISLNAVDSRVTSLSSGMSGASTRGTSTAPLSSSSLVTSSAVFVSATSGFTARATTSRVTIDTTMTATKATLPAKEPSQNRDRLMSLIGSPTNTRPCERSRASTRYSPRSPSRTVCFAPSAGTAKSCSCTAVGRMVASGGLFSVLLSLSVNASPLPSLRTMPRTVLTRVPGLVRPRASDCPGPCCRFCAVSSSRSSWLTRIPRAPSTVARHISTAMTATVSTIRGWSCAASPPRRGALTSPRGGARNPRLAWCGSWARGRRRSSCADRRCTARRRWPGRRSRSSRRGRGSGPSTARAWGCA